MTQATIIIAIVVAAGGGLGAFVGAVRAFQSPVFYAAVIALIWDKLKPALLEMIAKDFSPEHVAKVLEASRTGQPMKGNRHGPRHPGER